MRSLNSRSTRFISLLHLRTTVCCVFLAGRSRLMLIFVSIYLGPSNLVPNRLLLIVTTTASGEGALNFALLISRYIRQFLRVDPRVALQYVYSVCLSADQEGVGREQSEIAWELCRRVILMAEAGGGWEDLVGGF